MVLTGGPNTMAHQLQQSIPMIRHYIANAYNSVNTDDPPPPPPTIRPNAKWSKLLINSIPTGVTLAHSAMTLDECHAALFAENPCGLGFLCGGVGP
jgi:hypothetical protein